MIDNISFINSHWLWQIVLITIVIWFVFVWKEQKNFKKRAFYINCVVGIFALVSLALIVLKPTILNSSKSDKAVILTKSFNDTQLDSLSKIYKKLTVYSYEENQELIPKNNTPETVFVLGNGLQDYDLWQLDSINTIYIGGNPLKGISEFKYDFQNTVGNDVVFRGRYLKPQKNHSVFLEDPSGQVLDSITLNGQKSQDFQLSTNLKLKGNFVYQLVEKDSLGVVINREPLPLIIKEQVQFHILIINASPSFETKNLKNYLAESGHKVTIRSQMTKDRYKYEYFNMDNRPIIRFEQEQLKVYDLLIIDALSLTSLSSNAINAIKSSITNDGLGMFIQPEINFYKLNKPWYSFNFSTNKRNTSALNISPKNKISKFPFVFKNGILIESIFNENSNILSAYKRLGVGRIGTTVLQNTFELQLKGDNEDYKRLWSKTIESISKKDISAIEWNSNSPIVYFNEAFNFELRTNDARPKVTTRGNRIPLIRNVSIEDLWKGVTFPKQTGWQELKLQQDFNTNLKYYVVDSSHWQSVKANNVIKANKKFNNTNSNEYKLNTSSKPINDFWLFLIFICCIGYLWLEPKL